MKSSPDEPAKGRSRRILERLRQPQWRLVRIPAGIALSLAGLVGFLPLVGFWMLPLGLAILAIDIPSAGRLLNFLKGAAARLRGTKQ